MPKWIETAQAIRTSSYPARRLSAILLKKTGLCRLLAVRLDGYSIRFFPTAQSAAAWYEPRIFIREAQLLRRLVVPGAVCVDIGANVGLAALPMAQAAGSQGKVLAVEPDPRIAAFLAANLRLNRIEWAEVRNCAAGGQEGYIEFSRCRADDMSHVALKTDREKVQVPVHTLDRIAEGLEAIHLIKIDVEGYEREVIRGGKQALGRTSMVYIEASQKNCARYGYAPSTLVAELNDLGFHVYRLADGKLQAVELKDEPGASTENLIGARSPEFLRATTGWEFC
jgi:FkbM family methyltransferase